MKTIITLLILIALVVSSSALSPSWMNPNDTPRERALKLLKEMNQTEKILMVHGSKGGYVGNVPKNDRLGIPAIKLEDGPQGVADGVKLVTAWPSALSVVASWDRTLMYQYAIGMAQEQWAKGTNVMLGPMVNIARVPYGGRNFESFGEDPYLAGELVVYYVDGVQSQNVIANVKHFVDNSQETERQTISEDLSQRAQYELYYPAFKKAVDAGVLSVMCSYNKVDLKEGTAGSRWACENNDTLNSGLKEYMGFKGWVMSDWGATHSTIDAAMSGLDQEMPSDTYFGDALEKAISDGKVPQDRLDDMVLRMLTSMFTAGLFDVTQTGNLDDDVRSEAHSTLSRMLAESGTVLLKNNDNILPVNASQIKKLAILGSDAHDNPVALGGGSGSVIPDHIVTPLDAIKKRVGDDVKVTYVSDDAEKAGEVAAESDLAIIFAGTTSSEGRDRIDLKLPRGMDDYIEYVYAKQPNTIVVVHTPGALVMSWADMIPGIVCAWLPGQEDGNAITSILFGDVNPSGRLPITFPVSETQNPVGTPEQYPGVKGHVTYTEELLVGYRWFDAKGADPMFPFGHGLSYTTYEYVNMTVKSPTETVPGSIAVVVENTGPVAGAEVVQLYIGYPKEAEEPPQLLKGFEKILLEPYEIQTVTFQISAEDLSIFDSGEWRLVSGEYVANVGSSSRNILLTQKFDV